MTRTELEQHIEDVKVSIKLTKADYDAKSKVKQFNMDLFSTNMKLDYAIAAIRIDGELKILNRKMISLRADLDASIKALALMRKEPNFFEGEGDICIMEELARNGYLTGIKF